MKFEILPLVADHENLDGVIEVEQDGADFFGVYLFSDDENEYVWVNDFESKQAAVAYINHRKRMH